MATKPSWEEPRNRKPEDPAFGPRTGAVTGFLDWVRAFGRPDIERLDRAERRDAEMLLLAWDHVRDRLRDEPHRTWRFAARSAAWDAAAEAAGRVGIVIADDDGYWRVQRSIAYGTARIARYTACALIAPELLEPEMLAILRRPWRGTPIADALRDA